MLRVFSGERERRSHRSRPRMVGRASKCGPLQFCLLMACAAGLFFAGCSFAEVAAPRVVLLISIDTLRADHVGGLRAPDSRGKSVTPALDLFASDAVTFDPVV